ncbi:cytochrome c oxidase subunit IVB [Planococcus lenghuensis]|uniref:Cytochrome c oxidase subunit IVB n=1 Tax=Planococcus lenghuensis TaxID=2213202 RepID=A0A1Q2L0D0_9BACL|nr:cytochrome c oxidase subunit IVB [Planococcus lenghuensis]AQQ53824.1 cytochrome c oxidase subunit IVB [Planococcus lenghuensis]
MAHDVETHKRSQAEYEYAKRKREHEMRGQVATFALMIFLTLIAFTAVVADFSAYYVVPLILLLAAVQVVLQLYYFMHGKEKGHGTPLFFMYGGMLIAFTILVTFVTIIWI